MSAAHIIETWKHGNGGRRQRLAHVMAHLSQGWTISTPEQVSTSEFSMATAKALHKPVQLHVPVVFGLGIEFAFAEPLRAPTLVQALASNDAARRARALHLLELLLASPVEQLRKPGIDRYNARVNRLADHVDQVRKLVQTQSKSVQQRAFTARFVYDYLTDRRHEVQAVLGNMGASIDELLALGQRGLDDLYHDMPTADVELCLMHQRKLQHGKPIDAHDLSDLSFLTVAMPYCDIVVTEKQWVDLATRKGLRRMNIQPPYE